jgi:CubicO group peptidase (beta-lactamase class C family)
VSQLLKHSSGVGDIFKPEHQPRIASARTARELLPVIAAQQPLFAPGSQHRYSNTGALILGAVIEAVSGRPYATYVEENIFRPVGMGSSAIRAVPDNAAVMLTRSEVLTGEMRITAGQKLARRPTSFAGGGPFGGGYSSAPDLLRFASAMRSSRLVSETTKAALLSDPAAVPGAGPGRYAHGFQVSEEGGTKVVGHSGLAGGANAEFHWAPEDGWTLVVLSDYDPMSSTIIANAARLALTGMEKPEAACEAAKRGRGMPGPLGPPAGGRHGHSPGPGLGGGPIEQGRSPFKSIPSERGR